MAKTVQSARTAGDNGSRAGQQISGRSGQSVGVRRGQPVGVRSGQSASVRTGRQTGGRAGISSDRPEDDPVERTGRKAIDGSERKPKKEKKRGGFLRGLGRGVKLTLLAVVALLLTAILVVGIGFYAKYGKQLLAYQSKANTLVRRSTAETFKASQTSLVYAADGELISRLKGEKDVYYLEYGDIPKYAVQAMVCTEDRKFLEHDGVDLLANIRAAIVLIKNRGEIHQGGSTITQQLARTVFLSNEVTWERKITEIFVAMALERKYSKTQIMEFYLNNIYFANGYYGIQAAAVGYFGKGVGELSLSQIAFICAIPNNPTDYDPVTNFKYTMMRRDKVLDQMRDEGAIGEEEYREALEEKITLKQGKREIRDYAESYTYYCAIRALMAREGFVFRNSFLDDADKEKYDERYYEAYYRIQKTLFTGGYRIYTSIDLKKQEMLQRAVDEELTDFTEVNDGGVYKLQSSAACIDNRTGRVVAIVGGRSQESHGYTLNRAYQSFRQPGSAIKPLIVYTPMFERGMYPDDIVVDERFEGGPRNSGNVYSGEIPVSYAIAVSKNTVAWKLFEELTPRVGLSYLLQMGFRRIVDTDYVPAVSLGGFTYGVSAVELASGYAALYNDGYYREPTCIVKITDAQGNVLVGSEQPPKKVYATNAARMMTACMQGVMESGTGRKLKVDGQITAGKTGTTNDQKDGWFAGFTAYYTTAVWVGCDMPKAMDDLMGNTYPGRIWQNYMNHLHEGLPAKEFVMYTDTRPPEEEEGDEEENEGEEIKEGEEEEWEGNEGEGQIGSEGEGQIGSEGEGQIGSEGEEQEGNEGEGQIGSEGEEQEANEGEGQIEGEGEGMEGNKGEGQIEGEGGGTEGNEGEGQTEGEGGEQEGNNGEGQIEGEGGGTEGNDEEGRTEDEGGGMEGNKGGEPERNEGDNLNGNNSPWTGFPDGNKGTQGLNGIWEDENLKDQIKEFYDRVFPEK